MISGLRAHAAGIAALSAAFSSGPALAFDAAPALRSVVSVLPQWTGRPPNAAEPEGSGVVIAKGHHILTASHVLGNATAVLVRTGDGAVHRARIVGRDPATDLAVLRVAVRLPAARIGSEPRLADPVCAIGNQFGLGLSVTCGRVSALRRSGVGFNPVEDFIQTDATVNPGASGGGMFDEAGRLVGILSAIFTKRSDANIGVNFAVSAALAMRAAEALIASGKAAWPRLSFSSRPFPAKGGEGRQAVEVVALAASGRAARAGLEPGDRIEYAGSRRVRKRPDLIAAMALSPRPGIVLLKAIRNGKPVKLELHLDK